MSKSRALKNLAKSLSKKRSVAGKRRPAGASRKVTSRKQELQKWTKSPNKIRRSGRMSNLARAEMRGGEAAEDRAMRALDHSLTITGMATKYRRPFEMQIMDKAYDAGARNARKAFLASGRKPTTSRKGVGLKRKPVKRKRKR